MHTEEAIHRIRPRGTTKHDRRPKKIEVLLYAQRPVGRRGIGKVHAGANTSGRKRVSVCEERWKMSEVITRMADELHEEAPRLLRNRLQEQKL